MILHARRCSDLEPGRTMFERASMYRVAPFGVYVLFMLVADLLERFGWSGHDLRWLYAVKIAAVAGVIWVLRNAFVELRFPRAISRRSWGVAVLAGAAVFVAWINLHAGWMVIGASAGFDPRNAAGIGWWMVAARISGAVLVVPVMEELFWRSFLMRWIANHHFLAVDPARVGIGAFVITAVFFAFEHNLWLAGLVAGVVYNLLYIRSGNLWVPVVAHAVTNALLAVWVVYTGSWGYW